LRRLIGNTLVGTTSGSENFGLGTIFAINTDGTGFTTLHAFHPGTPAPINLSINENGYVPRAGLVQSGFNLYGTTEQGGSFGHGTVYYLSLLPYLNLTASVSNVVLTWPEHNAGFTTGFALESATNLNSSATWNPVSPGPTVVNGLNTVTNPILRDQMYYRLRQ
jgi:hypothetical protein